MFKINNKGLRRSGIFVVNFEHITHLALNKEQGDRHDFDINPT